MYCYYKCSVALPQGVWVGLQCVIVVFPDHTHLLFFIPMAFLELLNKLKITFNKINRHHEICFEIVLP